MSWQKQGKDPDHQEKKNKTEQGQPDKSHTLEFIPT